MPEDKLRQVDLMMLARAMAPELAAATLEYLGDQFEVLIAAKKNQDQVTSGLWNMVPVPGTNARPLTPTPETVNVRHTLEALEGWIEELREKCLKKCKTRSVTVQNGDGTTETKLRVEEPENAEQSKYTAYAERLDSTLSGIKKIHVKPVERHISAFRDDLVVHRTMGSEFLGGKLGQKHVGVTDKQIRSITKSLVEQARKHENAARDEDSEEVKGESKQK